jgi:hypothetical protein
MINAHEIIQVRALVKGLAEHKTFAGLYSGESLVSLLKGISGGQDAVVTLLQRSENDALQNFILDEASRLSLANAVNTSNPRSMATWTEAGITLYKGSNMTDLYHEAFHAFSQMFLSAKERQKIYDDVRKQKGTFTDYEGKSVKFEDADYLQVVEYLAVEFRKFMLLRKHLVVEIVILEVVKTSG